MASGVKENQHQCGTSRALPALSSAIFPRGHVVISVLHDVFSHMGLFHLLLAQTQHVRLRDDDFLLGGGVVFLCHFLGRTTPRPLSSVPRHVTFGNRCHHPSTLFAPAVAQRKPLRHRGHYFHTAVSLHLLWSKVRPIKKLDLRQGLRVV